MKIVLPGSRTNAYTPLMIEQRFCAYHSLLNIYLSNGNKKSLVTEFSQHWSPHAKEWAYLHVLPYVFC